MIALRTIFIVSLIVTTIPAWAGDGNCVVMSVEGEAWVKGSDDTVWKEMSEKDEITQGDWVRVYGGNAVKIAFGNRGQNVVWIQGQFDVKESSSRMKEIEIKSGKAVALLDGLSYGQGFKLTSPSAVAAVRGTRFQMKTVGQTAHILAYEGKVEVWGKTYDGNLLPRSVLLKAGQKTTISGPGSLPRVPVAMSESEWDEMSHMLWKIAPEAAPLPMSLPDEAYDYGDAQGSGSGYDSIIY